MDQLEIHMRKETLTQTYKTLLPLDIKKTNNAIKKWAEILKTYFFKEDV